MKSLVLLNGIALQKAGFFLFCFRSWLKGLLSVFKNHFRESSLDKTSLVTSSIAVLEEFVISSLKASPLMKPFSTPEGPVVRKPVNANPGLKVF